MAKQILITIHNEEEFDDALAEIKSNLDYDNIEFDYNIIENYNDGVKISKDVICEIDGELFFNEISMDTKSWSFDYDDLEQNTKVFEYVKEYYPRELQALKDGRTDYLTVYYD